MHYELDFSSWDTPDKLHKTSSLYIQRGIDGYGLRETLDIPQANMFVDELEIFADACRSKKINQLTARDGNIAVAVVMAALKSVDNGGRLISVDEVLERARNSL